MATITRGKGTEEYHIELTLQTLMFQVKLYKFDLNNELDIKTIAYSQGCNPPSQVESAKLVFSPPLAKIIVVLKNGIHPFWESNRSS